MGNDTEAFGEAPVEVFEAIALGRPLPSVLEAIVRLVERQAPGMFCSVLRVDANASCLRPAAAPNLPPTFVATTDGLPIAADVGACGAAAARRETVVCEDIATHPNWRGVSDRALRHGLLACWSTPIFSPEGEVLGTFAMYFKERRCPSDRERQWVAGAVHLASIAFVRERAEQKLRSSETRARELARLYTVSSSVSEALVRTRVPEQLYELACRIAVEKGLAVIAWVGVYDASIDHLVPVARFGDDDDYVDAIQLKLLDLSMSEGPAARTIRGGTVQISDDIENDPTFYWKREALKRGLRSCAVFPLRIGGETRAVFVIYGATTHFFKTEEINVLTTLADNIAFAVESAENDRERRGLYNTLDTRVKELTLLHRVARVLQTSCVIDAALLGTLADLVRTGCPTPEHCEVRLRWQDIVAETPGFGDLTHTIDVALGTSNERLGELTVRRNVGRTEGPPSPDGPFRMEEQELLRSLGDMISSHLGRLEAERTAMEREGRLRFLHDVGDAIRAADDPDAILATVVRMLGTRLHVSRCAYAMVEPNGDHFVVPEDYTDGVASIAGRHQLSRFGPWILDALTRVGAAVVNDVRAEVPDPKVADELIAAGTTAFVCVSLVKQGVLRAMLAVHHATPRTWTRDEIQLVTEIAERAWATIKQRSAEAMLRRNEALLRIAGRAARLGGWTMEMPVLRATWSDEVCEIFGVPSGTAPTFEQVVACAVPAFRDMLREQIQACAGAGTPFDIELPIEPLEGGRRWIRAIGMAERNAAGAIVRIQGAIQNVEDRRRLEEQLQQAQKMEAVGQLAGGVAHDFNNILSVILSYASFLIEGLEPADPMRADIEEIQKAGERAGQLTRQLLALSRQQVLEPRVLDLGEVVVGLEKMLLRIVGEDITLAFHTASDLGFVLADPGQIEQVVMNLVVNARDAMPRGGSLTIETANTSRSVAEALSPGAAPSSSTNLSSADTTSPYVRIAISDSGSGMDEPTRARIFEPFFTTKEKGKGTGLGLSTVYGIVTQSGGHIEVSSEPNVGTTFEIFLPRVHQPLSAKPVEERMTALQGNETILVVEDEDQVRTIVRAILRRAGYQVLDAQNGGEALLICEKHPTPIQLLMTDVILPRMSGRELAERLRPLRPEMGVLYVSGYTRDAIVQHGVVDSGTAFLTKPVTPSPLLRKVREVLDARRHGPAPAHGGDEPRGRGRHVLHVDDETALVELTSRILKRLGYRVTGFTDPEEALACFRSDPSRFDAVVTDVAMPGLSGFELIRALWQEKAGLPVVLTSGDFRPEDIRSAKALGIGNLVVKPETVDELGRVLDEIFSRTDEHLPRR